MWQKPHGRNFLPHENPAVERKVKQSDEKSIPDQLPPLNLDTQSGIESWSQHITHLGQLTNEQLLTEFTNLSFMEPCLGSHDKPELKLRLMMFWSLDNLDPIFGATRPGRHMAAAPSQTRTSHLAFYETQGQLASNHEPLFKLSL